MVDSLQSLVVLFLFPVVLFTNRPIFKSSLFSNLVEITSNNVITVLMYHALTVILISLMARASSDYVCGGSPYSGKGDERTSAKYDRERSKGSPAYDMRRRLAC